MKVFYIFHLISSRYMFSVNLVMKNHNFTVHVRIQSSLYTCSIYALHRNSRILKVVSWNSSYIILREKFSKVKFNIIANIQYAKYIFFAVQQPENFIDKLIQSCYLHSIKMHITKILKHQPYHAYSGSHLELLCFIMLKGCYIHICCFHSNIRLMFKRCILY